jgi:NADH-quinone oxidoreductase subunit J
VLVEILFWVFASILAVAALGMITVRNPVHAALLLVLCFFTSASIWLLIEAEFLAVVLILVYVGAVMVLFIFGTMLTRAQIGRETDLNNRGGWALGLFVGLVLLGTLCYALLDAFGDDELPDNAVPTTTAQVSDSIFSVYLLPFWALGIVLTAAVVGAIVLARRD